MYNTDIKDMNIEAEELSVLSVYQLDYSSVDNSTLQCCVVHDGASDDRADKCSISGYYHHRKRHLALHTTTTDKQCKYIIINKLCTYVHSYVCSHISLY